MVSSSIWCFRVKKNFTNFGNSTGVKKTGSLITESVNRNSWANVTNFTAIKMGDGVGSIVWISNSIESLTNVRIDSPLIFRTSNKSI